MQICYRQNLLKKCSGWGVLGLKRPQNLTLLKNVKTKIFIFDYLPIVASEMSSTHRFYPFFDTQHSICEKKLLHKRPRESQKSIKNLMISKNCFICIIAMNTALDI